MRLNFNSQRWTTNLSLALIRRANSHNNLDAFVGTHHTTHTLTETRKVCCEREGIQFPKTVF